MYRKTLIHSLVVTALSTSAAAQAVKIHTVGHDHQTPKEANQPYDGMAKYIKPFSNEQINRIADPAVTKTSVMKTQPTLKSFSITSANIQANANSCADANSLASLSITERINQLKNASDFDCLKDSLWNVDKSLMQTLFNQADMIKVLNAATAEALGYDGVNVAVLENLVLYIRVGRWAQWGNEDIIGAYDQTFHQASYQFLDTIAANSNFYATSESHGKLISQIIILMGGTDYSVRYIDVAKNWLSRYNKDWGYDMQSAFTNVLTLIYRGSFDPNFVDHVNSDTSIVTSLKSFIDNNGALIGDYYENQLNDATSELGRMLGYGGATFTKVKPLVKDVLTTYSMTGNGAGAWINAANMANYYDGDNCDYYGTCNFEQELEAQVLPIRHECSDTLVVRAQELTSEQLTQICSSLAIQETYFHQKLNTNNTPVPDDLNTALELVIYDSSADYKRYSGIIFEHSTDNGGIYLEGVPSEQGNIPRFFAYEAEWEKPDFEVWNLNHEYTHYLDGRFNLYGGFELGNSYDTVWWSEGLADYIAKKNFNDHAVNVARDKLHSLSSLFRNNYNDSTQEQIYTWGYLAVRYMFERRRADVDQMIAYMRAGNFDQYAQLLDSIGTSYDSDFNSWLETVESTGGPVEPPQTNELVNGESVVVSSDGSEQPAFFTSIPENASNLIISISGGSGDADLHIKQGQEATTDVYDHRPWLNGNNESVTIEQPVAGPWHIMLNPYQNQGFSDVTLSVSWEAFSLANACDTQASTTYETLTSGEAICVGQSPMTYFSFWVDEGTTELTITSAHGSGDVSLYHSSQTWPSTSDYENSSTAPESNRENITVTNPSGGWHYISATGHESDFTLLMEQK
ncbi:collagenase [Thalassotalea ganghwensis]